ncbi:MAG: class I SAM-dependent methyltransferase [Candidatus Competibacteraceae bacterium]|nr:class I SAM-dependent methyltransferase [Candidatus Competibacteraceae bacterium]MCP5124395.1 class I SAM-dependent methyltransferase [Gammaproteobacteria bacterium]
MTGKMKRDTEKWDYSSDPNFYRYYEEQSLSSATLERLATIRDKILDFLGNSGKSSASVLDVADIGCGAGTQCRIWAERGYNVFGVDINEPLIELARRRTHESGLAIRFEIGSATQLPFQDESMDVCLLPELLEHVEDWQGCLCEASRILKPGGVLYLSTTNVLCPKQEEFNLPLYSWYPSFLKHRYERLATTTRPELANYARYPAVHWFSFYGLSSFLAGHKIHSYDRFDILNTDKMGIVLRLSISMVRALPPLRFVGHIFTPYTAIFGVKNA